MRPQLRAARSVVLSRQARVGTRDASQHLACIELLDRTADVAEHFADDAGRLGEVR